jgi:hypothetical protein
MMVSWAGEAREAGCGLVCGLGRTRRVRPVGYWAEGLDEGQGRSARRGGWFVDAILCGDGCIRARVWGVKPGGGVWGIQAGGGGGGGGGGWPGWEVRGPKCGVNTVVLHLGEGEEEEEEGRGKRMCSDVFWLRIRASGYGCLVCVSASECGSGWGV